MDTSKMIFVFGSNLGGIHGAGAAAFAAKQRGALLGVGVGPTGQSYALPTKGLKNSSTGRLVIGPTLRLDIIQDYIDDFLKYATQRSDLEFQVTCVGCGLAGLKHEHIAPMFEKAPMNCFFDDTWKPWLTKASHRFWGMF